MRRFEMINNGHSNENFQNIHSIFQVVKEDFDFERDKYGKIIKGIIEAVLLSVPFCQL